MKTKNLILHQGGFARKGNTLFVYDYTTGVTRAYFVGDDPITSIAVSGNIIMAGDTAGRVLFLRYDEEDRQALTFQTPLVPSCTLKETDRDTSEILYGRRHTRNILHTRRRRRDSISRQCRRH